MRPGAAGLLIGIECSRVRDNSWMYLISLVTTRIGVELAQVQRKLLDCVVVGLQLYSARTFHVTLSRDSDKVLSFSISSAFRYIIIFKSSTKLS